MKQIHHMITELIDIRDNLDKLNAELDCWKDFESTYYCVWRAISELNLAIEKLSLKEKQLKADETTRS